jgi:acyl CoA:acetate/3-ketoacid CoA transferase
VLEAVAPGIDIEQDVLELMEFAPIIVDEPGVLDPVLFA